jgi:nucleotide-binding universal stress UspA family protein
MVFNVQELLRKGEKMYQKILVPMDGSELAECVLPHVDAITKGCSVPEVVFVRVLEPLHHAAGGGDYYIGVEEWKKLEADNKTAAKDYMKKLAARVKLPGARTRYEILPSQKNPAEVIAEYATKEGADLVVISTHGRSGISRWVLGSVADRILRSACVPVLMVRAPGCVPGVQS